jgi:hypothetical protein
MILLPRSVREIEESAFKDCIGLEVYSIHKGSMLVRIGQAAFAGSFCPKSFYVPKSVERIGELFQKMPFSVATDIWIRRDTEDE